MTEVQQIFLTPALALIGGWIVFIFGEFFKVLIVFALQKYKEQEHRILGRLDFYANRITNHFSAEPNDEEWELIKEMAK